LYRIEYISNSGVTEEEFKNWVKIMQKAKLPILTPQDISQRRQQIEYADNYVWTDSEINKRVEKARKLKLRPVNIVRERFNLMEELQLLQAGAQDEYFFYSQHTHAHALSSYQLIISLFLQFFFGLNIMFFLEVLIQMLRLLKSIND
jgi:predicted NodU family carbamoyl transferase